MSELERVREEIRAELEGTYLGLPIHNMLRGALMGDVEMLRQRYPDYEIMACFKNHQLQVTVLEKADLQRQLRETSFKSSVDFDPRKR